MRRFVVLVLLTCAVVALAGSARAAEFHLNNGTVLRGDAASFNDDGLVVRLSAGGFSDRIPWGRLTDDTLVQLLQNPKAREFVEPFVALPSEQKAKKQARAIVLKEVPRVERPEKAGLLAGFASPGGLVILAALLLASVYAGYEVALYRNRPPAVVCCISAILPLVGTDPLPFAAAAGSG